MRMWTSRKVVYCRVLNQKIQNKTSKLMSNKYKANDKK